MPSALQTRNVLGLLGAFVVTAMAGGVLAAGLAMPAVGASGALTKNSVTFFDSLPSDLSQPPLAEKSKLLDKNGKTITTFYDENRDNVTLDKISENMQAAIVSIEDARFFEHGGVDPKGLARAAIVNKISGGVEQGASTLTQQYVKNVLKESALARGDKAAYRAASEQTTARKLKEIRLAVALEKEIGKPEILNRYLNIAWFGGKINGVQAAAKYYFNTTAAKLTLPQAATLAGMIQSPPQYSPENEPKAAVARRNVVLAKMLQLGKIDQATHDAAIKAKLGAKITPVANGCANAGQNAYYCEYVRRQLIDNDAFSNALGDTPTERENTLKRGGLTIQTAMDPKIMKAAWKALSSKVHPKDKVASASVTVEPGTGLVRSIQQSKTYDPSGKNKAGKTAINYSVDNEWGGGNGFQTGSTFKPFTLATWLKAGKSLNATVDSSTGTAPFSAFKSCNPDYDNSQSYTYFNSEGSGKGSMSVFAATYKSVNGAFVSMEKQLNLCDIRETAEDLGVHLAKARDNFCTVKKNDTTDRLPNCVPALTLGVADISPMTMAAAYAGFSAKGEFCKPIAVVSITNRDGKKLPIPKADCKQTIDEKVANTVNYGLSKALTPVGTAARVGPLSGGRPASGKTGTTNGSVDTWFVGYTPQLSTAVWVGDPNTYKISKNNYARKSLNGRTIGGVYYSRVFGATIAGVIWKKIMEPAVAGTEIKYFARADSKLLVTPKTTVPNVNGRSVKEAEAILKAAGFTTSVSNTPVKSKYPAGSVASTSPAGGSRASTGTSITISVSAGGGDDGDDGDDNGDGDQPGGGGGGGGRG